MIIKWTDLAYDSFEDEIDFIINKWNKEEALKFSALVKGFLILLEENPYLGKMSSYKGFRQFVLSTQTKVWYKIDEKMEIIYISFFWNNKKHPTNLIKHLK